MHRHRFKKDTLVIGALAGIIAKSVQTILGFMVIALLPSFVNCSRIAAGIVFSPEQVMKNGLWPTLVGIQIDFIVGIVVAVVTVIILQRWGHDYYIFKGAMIGWVSWALFYCVVSRFLSQIYPEGPVLHIQISLFKHLAFGVSLTWSALWLSKWFERRS